MCFFSAISEHYVSQWTGVVATKNGQKRFELSLCMHGNKAQYDISH